MPLPTEAEVEEAARYFVSEIYQLVGDTPPANCLDPNATVSHVGPGECGWWERSDLPGTQFASREEAEQYAGPAPGPAAAAGRARPGCYTMPTLVIAHGEHDQPGTFYTGPSVPDRVFFDEREAQGAALRALGERHGTP
jgi:hypothetical protein